MKTFVLILALSVSAVRPGLAIPNSVFGPILQSDSPLNGRPLDGLLLGKGIWTAEEALPGDWQNEGQVGTSSLSYLLARPKLFGQEVLLLRSSRRAGVLVQLEATFVDAGSYFGYFDEELPEGLSRRQRREEMSRRLSEKQESFSDSYHSTLSSLREALAEKGDRPKPKVRRFGKGRMLRVEPEEWTVDELVVRLFNAPGRLVRVTIAPKEEVAEGWLERGIAGESGRERLERLRATVSKHGSVVHINGISTVPQGYKPYCGLNTLAMTARHFGLTLDEDWMAAAAGFQNTGSAGGSNMVKLYHAVAAEAGLSLDRSSKFAAATVKRSLDHGMPVIVWRRFSHDRNQLHDRIARDPDAELPDPAMAAEQATWPGEDAPLHASVITGYDSVKDELLFLESWSGRDRTRRMKTAEMAATTYLCFAFEP